MSNLNVRGQCRCVFIVKDHVGRHIDTLSCILPTGHEGVHMDMNGNTVKGQWMNRNDIMEGIHKGQDNPFAKSATGQRRRVFYLPNIRLPK